MADAASNDRQTPALTGGREPSPSPAPPTSAAYGVLLDKLGRDLAGLDEGERGDVLLVGHSLPAEVVAWAESNGVEWQQDPDVPSGQVYIINRAAIKKLSKPWA